MMGVILDENMGRVVFDDRRFRCHSCNATGLYQGLAEPKGAAVECTTCEGTGFVNYIRLPFSATDEIRNPPPSYIQWVYSPVRMSPEDPPRRKIPIVNWLNGDKP